MSGETLAKLSHVAFIVTCAVLVSLAGVRAWNERAPAATTNVDSASDEPVRRGTRLLPVGGVSYQKSAATVALVLNSRCGFCTASMPFYQRLVQAPRQGKVQVVAFSSEPLDVLKSYIRKHGLKVDAVAGLQGSGIETWATPTVILVNAEAKVDRSWIGQLAQDQEQDVLKAVEATAAGRS